MRGLLTIPYVSCIKKLTKDEIKKVYAGEIANWKELGWPYRQISKHYLAQQPSI